MESSTKDTATFGGSSSSTHHDDAEEKKRRKIFSPSHLLTIFIVLSLIIGGVVAPTFLFLYSDRGPHTFTHPPLMIPADMAVIIGLCVIAVMLPLFLGMWARRRNAKTFGTRKSNDVNRNETMRMKKERIWKSIRCSLREGLYIELHKRPSLSDLMEEARKNSTVLPLVMEEEELSMEEKGDDEELEEEETDGGYDGGKNEDRPIGPGCLAKEHEIREYYKNDNDNTDNTDDKVVFVLRLALGLLAAGHCTVDVETTVLRTAAALQLPTPRLSVGHRLLQAQFGQTPPHFLTCKRDFVFSMLKDLQMLADSVIAGEINPNEAHIALEVLNRMLDTPLPYGWIIYDLVFVSISPWASVAAYYGSYWDMLGAICLSPITVLTYRLCQKLNISHLEEILVPFNIGLVAPLVWRFCNGGQDFCHITPMYMGALLIHLPGAELVWGAIEVLQGSVIHGASRLIKGLIQATSLAVFLSLGWQVFGRNLAEDWLLESDGSFKPRTIGAVASLPDSSWCEEAFPKYYPHYFSWYFVIGVYNMPLNILCLANVFIPVRDWLGPFIVGQVGLLSLGFLQFQCTAESCEIPSAVQNLLSAYAATWVAMVVEVVSGLPSPISVIPVLFIFAPGSAAVLSMVGNMHRQLGDVVGTNTSSWEDIIIAAFTFGVGIFLAEQTWKPLLKAQFTARREAAQKKKASSNSKSDEEGGDIVLSNVNGDSLLTFDIDENFHSPQMIAHGNSFTNAYKKMFGMRKRQRKFEERKKKLTRIIGHS